MISVSCKARRHLIAVLEHVEILEGATLRLETVRMNGGGGRPDVVMCAGVPGEKDQSVEHKGEVLLSVAPMVSAAYDGCVLDVIQTHEGIRFSLAAPESVRGAL